MTQVATAEQAWSKLIAGNKIFFSGSLCHKHQDAETHRVLVAKKAPFAATFGCSDSKLAAETIFDVGLGDLFVSRNAGISAQQWKKSVKGELIHNIVNRITPTIERGLVLGETSIEEFANRHIKNTSQEITNRSEVIRERIAADQVAIVGAQPKLELGEVQVVEYRGKIESTR